MIGFLLLFVATASAAPLMFDGSFDGGYLISAKALQGMQGLPTGYAVPAYNFYGAAPSSMDDISPEYLISFPRQSYVAAMQPQPVAVAAPAPVAAPIPAPVATQPVACGPPAPAPVAKVQQQAIGVVQNQETGPTQIYRPAPSPPMVVNPAPVVVRPPPPPPIYVQPQKIYVQPPQVPAVYASNPQVYYAQQNCPNCPQGVQAAQ